MIRAMSKRLCGLTWAAPSSVWVNRRFISGLKTYDDVVVNISNYDTKLFRVKPKVHKYQENIPDLKLAIATIEKTFNQLNAILIKSTELFKKAYPRSLIKNEPLHKQVKMARKMTEEEEAIVETLYSSYITNENKIKEKELNAIINVRLKFEIDYQSNPMHNA